MRILGIESSCDETGVALYDTDRGAMAEMLYSQSTLHQSYGGVVPELAARDHARRLLPLTQELLRHANTDITTVSAIAYTAGPGLVGALLVGASFARSLAYARDIPSIAIHHMEGHLLVVMLGEPKIRFPFLALLVSGGHTMLLRADGIGDYHTLGTTCDDAAGEAFDKTAKLLGLAYPGGAALAQLAEHGDAHAIALPRPMTDKKGALDFSFSGLKTRVSEEVRARRLQDGSLSNNVRADIAASFQEAVVDTVVLKCTRALQQTGLTRLVIAGGVAANQNLRLALDAAVSKLDAQLYCPPQSLCTDNGMMIAYAGWLRMRNVHLADMPHNILPTEVNPRWNMEQLNAQK